MSWGDWGAKFSTKEQTEMINFCLENGNTIFDHADIYGNYTTEVGFGKAFKESGVSREKIHLISKCGIQLINKDRKSTIKHYNYSKEYIIKSAEQSLRNLKTDFLDTFLLHRPSALMQPNEIAEAVLELKTAGKIKQFGVSNFTPSQLDLLATEIEIATNQIEVSLTQNTAMFNGTLDKMMQKNIKPMCWSPLGTVFKLENEQTKRIHKVLENLVDKYTTTKDVLLLAFILKHPAKISPVIGTTNRARILNANKALDINLEVQDWFALLEASRGEETP